MIQRKKFNIVRRARLLHNPMQLEERATPADLFGVVWRDSLGGGTPNGGELVYSGVTIKAYLDGGDGIFNNGGGDDILQATTTTAPDGSYNLNGVAAGKIFVDIDETNALVVGQKLAIGT